MGSRDQTLSQLNVRSTGGGRISEDEALAAVANQGYTMDEVRR